MKSFFYTSIFSITILFFSLSFMSNTLNSASEPAPVQHSFKHTLLAIPGKAYNTAKSYFDFLELKSDVEAQLKEHANNPNTPPEIAQAYNNLAFKLKAYSLSALANIPLWVYVHPSAAILAVIAQYTKIYSLVKDAENLLKHNNLSQEEAQNLAAQIQQADTEQKRESILS